MAYEPAVRLGHAPVPLSLDGASGAALLEAMCSNEHDCAADSILEAQKEKPRAVFWFEPPPPIAAAIANASAATGISFDYLLRTAALESSFDPLRKARTSSATGLFQFIEQTWLYMLRETGAELGLREHADAIVAGEGGYSVSDEELRAEILSLRYDPGLSAILAGLFTARNAEFLTRSLGRDPGSGELYLAHFLGAPGAAALIRLCEEDPEADSSKHFGRAARANRSIFYQGGKPRSVVEVYDTLVNKYYGVPILAKEPALQARPAQPDWWNPPAPMRLLGDHEFIYAMN